MMEDLIKHWEGETVIARYDRPSDAWILIAIHSTHLGPAAGGTRMKTYPDVASALKDAQRLAEPKDAERLRQRGILYAPDYVINAGGAIFLVGMETRGWTRHEAENMVTEGVQDALSHIFELALTQDITTESAARQVAELRLSPDL